MNTNMVQKVREMCKYRPLNTEYFCFCNNIKMPDDPNSAAVQHIAFYTVTRPALAVIPNTSFFTYILSNLYKLQSSIGSCKLLSSGIAKVL